MFEPDKVKVMVFRHPKSIRPHNQIRININNFCVTESYEERILGTILDSKLSFVPHFKATVQQCYGILNAIKCFTRRNNCPYVQTYIKLYVTLIRSKLSFSIAAITNINKDSLAECHALQHMSLCPATQCLPQTSQEVLNLLTNTLPVDFVFKERIAEYVVLIQSRNNVYVQEME